MPAGKSCRNPQKFFLGRAANRKRQRYACCKVGGRPADRLHCTSTFADASALTSRLIKGHAESTRHSQQLKASAMSVTHSQSCDFPRRKLAKSTTPIATKRLLPSRNLRPHPLQNTHSTPNFERYLPLRPCDPFATHWCCQCHSSQLRRRHALKASQHAVLSLSDCLRNACLQAQGPAMAG